MLLFQKDCQACKKQVTNLDCFPLGTEIFLLGTFSTEKDLRREYKKLKTSFPAYYADREALKFFEITKKLTPQIIIFNGIKKMHFSGLQNCAELRKKLFGEKKHE